MIVGDIHNYGRQTKRVVIDGLDCFLKSRTIYWEWFFLGKNSPLLSFIQQHSQLSEIFSCFFSLQSEFKKYNNNFFVYEGYVLSVDSISIKEVEKLDESKVKNIFYSFGSLCAYSYCFGLADLNHENVLITNQGGLQPIDIEVVFAKPRFLSETGLISAGGSFLDEGCFSSMLRSTRHLDESAVFQIIGGFYNALRVIQQHECQITTFFTNCQKTLEEIPIRNIFRDTEIYYAWQLKHNKNLRDQLSDPGIINLLKKLEKIESYIFPEEIEQLERGDIPYFFSKLNEPDIFYVGSEDGYIKKIKSNKGLLRTKSLSKFDLDLNWRFSKDRLLDSCLPAGMVEIIWDLLPKEYKGTLKCDQFEIVVNENTIRINDRGLGYVYIAARSYNPNDRMDFVKARSEILKLKLGV